MVPAMPSLHRSSRHLLLACLILAGGTSIRSISAQEPVPAALDGATAGADVHALLDIRPRVLLENPEFRRYMSKFASPNDPGIMGATLRGKVEQVLILGTIRPPLPKPEVGGPHLLAMVIRATEPYNWTKYPTWKTEEVRADGFTYKRGEPDWFFGGCYRILDDRTLLVGTEDQVVHPPIPIGQGPTPHDWDAAWARFPNGPFRLTMDHTWLATFLGKRAEAPAAHLVAPLLDRTRAFALSMAGTDGLAVDAVAVANDRFEAPRVRGTVEAARTLARNLLPQLRTPAWNETPATTQDRNALVDKLDPVLGAVTIDQDGTATRAHLQADRAFLANAVDYLVPALPNGWDESMRLEAARKMKDIGQAIFRYENNTGRKLHAVMYGRDGKTPHSWRVALLPYLGAGYGNMVLYSEYNFEEPWDSPSNSRLIDRMPRVYEDPDIEHTHLRASIPSYFLVTGPATMCPLRTAAEQPRPFLDSGYHPVDRGIADSAYQTIQLVEAKRDIPWTRPEDVAFDEDGPPPALGGFHEGGFHVLFADGHVEWLKATIAPKILRAMMTANGHEIIREGDYEVTRPDTKGR